MPGGPTDGHPVVLLHGGPYDIHCYADVSDVLAEQGFRGHCQVGERRGRSG